jgi:hypothetical protein
MLLEKWRNIMKQDKKRYFVISSEIYHQDILVCFNMTPIEVFKIYKRKNVDATEEDRKFIEGDKEHVSISTLGTMYPMSKGYIVILKWYKDSFRRNLCCAIHELTHVSHYILRNIRILLTEDNVEAYPYLIANLLRQFLFKLYKNKSGELFP